MITLKTDCNNCIHKKMCRNRNHAENDMITLKNMNYGFGSNDDYDWETMSTSRNVNIEFSCPDYMFDASAKTLNFRSHGAICGELRV